ncbi:RHS repeat-associated core domain-containing protein [Sporocytophaga myxococcoides]|uniref:RHS repeat-associated core domain-containing protein n=2 Tax=Sporocytophaga myxococcoides TaxID=153721 RepID=A0A098LL74_9BACT|nr:RHS repeat-associated core domain-containing protein [Sporocytophaga myxococcoides]
MDDLTYKYETIANGYTRNTNRLRSVSDAVGNGNYADDIDNQANNNYDYDEIGNLKSDVQEGIATIEWTVSGKISKVTRSSGSTKPDLEFKYDALGNRVAKISKPPATKTDASTWTTLYYVRDGVGNVMSTYEQRKTTSAQEFFLKDQTLYGINRLGLLDKDKNLTTLTAISNSIFATSVGKKLFEASNHLGNILTVFTDRKIPVVSGQNVLSYTADITSTADYYAFGSLMPGRKYTKVVYRYGFNGKEKDNEFDVDGSDYDFGARMYDSRLGRFLSIDPDATKFAFQSPYTYAQNTPIQAIDKDGKFLNFILKYGVEVGINIATQMLTAYMFDENVKSFEEAYDKVSFRDAIFESAVDMVSPGKLKVAGEAVISIFKYIDEVGIDNVTTQGLLEAGLTTFIENALGDKFEKLGKDAVQKGMKKLGVSLPDLDFKAASANAKDGKVALDNNTLIAAIEKGEKAEVIKAIGGKKPVISTQAAKEFLVKGDKDKLKSFMKDTGATMSKKGGSKAQVDALREEAAGMKRSLHPKDAKVVADAINNNATIITRDVRLTNFINATKRPVIGY